MSDQSVQGSSGLLGSFGANVSSTSTSTEVTTKGPRLSNKEGWERWKVWFRAQLYIHNCKDQFKDGGDVATLNKLYGILASSIDGEAVTIVSNLNKEGDGFAAYEALEKAFGDHRKVLLTHRLREAITRKQNANVSAKDYLLQKRDHFSKVEAAFANDHAKLWDRVRQGRGYHHVP